jgi:hypothetical protein
MSSAASKFDAKSRMTSVQITMLKQTRQAEPKDTLFFHLEYHHPHGIPRNTIRDIYNKSLESHSGFKRMVVPFSRLKKLQDALMRKYKVEPPGSCASDYILNTSFIYY